MGTILTLLVGLFIGWNFPQPAFAKALQARIVAWFHSTTA